MYLLFFFIIVFVFFLNALVSNFLVWWGSFVLSTLVFIWVCKVESSYICLVNYFVVQEVMNLLFLYFSGFFIQLLFLFSKSGISPLHFWVFSVSSGLSGMSFLWFLVFQKLPFIPVIFLNFDYVFFYLILFGILLCHFSYMFFFSDSSMMVISSTESFNWCVLMVCYSYYGGYVIIFFYFFVSCLIISFVYNISNFFFLSWESVFFFMNVPLGLVFFVKFFVFSYLYGFSYFLFLFFFSVVFSYLCLFFWMVGLSLYSFFNFNFYGFFVWFLFILSFLFLL